MSSYVGLGYNALTAKCHAFTITIDEESCKRRTKELAANINGITMTKIFDLWSKTIFDEICRWLMQCGMNKDRAEETTKQFYEDLIQTIDGQLK